MTETLDKSETGRIEAFSDGVFAIAITLLVLAIKVPKAADLGSNGSLISALLGLWPQFLAFVTSFATIFAIWVNHHRIFTFVQRSDHFFSYWNGLLFLLITFLPFSGNFLRSGRLPHSIPALRYPSYLKVKSNMTDTSCGLPVTPVQLSPFYQPLSSLNTHSNRGFHLAQ